MDMERFFVVTNDGKDKDGQVTRRVKELLEGRRVYQRKWTVRLSSEETAL